jgi:hypothetical protein
MAGPIPPEPNEPEVIEFNLLGRGDLAAIKSFKQAVENLSRHISGQGVLRNMPAVGGAATTPTGAESALPPTRPEAAYEGDRPGERPHTSVQPIRIPTVDEYGHRRPEHQEQPYYGDRGDINPQTGSGQPPRRNVNDRGATPTGPPPPPEGTEYQQEQTAAAASTPPARLDRTLQRANKILGMARRSPLHSALQLAGGVATAKVVGNALGDDEGEGNSLTSSYLGSVLAAGGGPGGGGDTGGGGASRPPVNQRAANIHEAINLASTAFLTSRALGGAGSRLAQGGTNMGYDPGAILNIPGTDIGMRTPFQAGGGLFGIRGGGLGVSALPQLAPNIRQEIDRRWNILRLRFQGGMSGRQARQVFDQTSAEGFSGQEAEDIAFRHVAPLVQQGQDPALATSMVVQAARNSNTSLEEISRTLDDLGVSARNARQTLNEYQQGLDQFAEGAEQLGATRNQGVELGRRLTDTLGITPQQANQIPQSTMIQAFAFQRHGILPNAIGTADPSAVLEATNQTVQRAWQMTSMFGQRTTDPTTGKQISQKQADQNHAAQAAQVAGLDVETYLHLRRTGRQAVARSEGLKAVEQYGGRWNTFRQETRQGGTLANIPEGSTATGQTDDEIARNKRLNTQRERARDLASTQLRGRWGDVRKELEQAAPTRDDPEKRHKYFEQLDRISKMKDPGHQAHEARRLLMSQAKEDMKEKAPSVTLDLTGAAKRLVRQLENDDPAKRDHGRGGKPVNKSRSEPDQKQTLAPGEGGYA